MSGDLMTTAEVLHWIAEIFETPSEKIEVSSLRSDIPGWDSLGMLSLMAGLDERFNIQVLDRDVGKLKSVNDILDILRHHGVVRDG